jgi:hypothetical protein
MGWRQVVLLWAVLAVLAAEWWLVERRRTPPAADAAPARPRLVAVEPAALREVRLLRGDRRVVARRDAGSWRVVEPAGAVVPPDLVAAFVNTLTAAEEIQRLGGADAGAYGLGERALRVELVDERGAAVVVTLGASNPTGTALYAQRADAPDVVLIGRDVRFYEDLIFQAIPGPRAPAVDDGGRIGG